MKLYRGIFSLLLLSAYALLLLHDCIPHTHQNHQEVAGVSSIFNHSHEGHHHSHDHHERKNKENNQTDSSENNLFDDRLFDSHKHSNNNGHHHDLVYRSLFKTEPNPEILSFEYLPIEVWKLPDRLDNYSLNQFTFAPTFCNPFLSTGHNLRGPPVLS